MKTIYRLKVWSYDMGADVPTLYIEAFNDADAKREMEIILKAYPAYLMVHLQRLSWEDVVSKASEPVRKAIKG